MRMFLVEHVDGNEWVSSVREDLGHGHEANTHALFYTRAEAHAYIEAMCGLIHCGGRPADFQIVEVEHDGESFLRIGDWAESGDRTVRS